MPQGDERMDCLLRLLDKAIADAVDAAKASGLPQRLLHAHAQTHQMVGGSP